MATTAGAALAHILKRLRSTGTLAITTGFALEAIHYSQITMGVGRNLVLVNADNFTYTSGTCLYTLSAAVSTDCARLVSLYSTSRTVPRVSFSALKQYDRMWYSSTNTTSGSYVIQAWAPIGEEMIAIYPSPASGGVIQCTYVKQISTGAVATTATSLEVNDKDKHLVYDLAEIVLLAHLRRTPECKQKITGLRAKLGLPEQ
jgi:hypothetical protein